MLVDVMGHLSADKLFQYPQSQPQRAFQPCDNRNIRIWLLHLVAVRSPQLCCIWMWWQSTFIISHLIIILGIFNCTMEEFTDKYFTSTTPQMTTSAIMFSTLYTINLLTLGSLFITTRYNPQYSFIHLQPTPTPKVNVILGQRHQITSHPDSLQ